jgi:hypothetical protein
MELTDFDKLQARIIEKNLDYQVNVACKKYKDLVQSESLTVIGATYDFKGEYGKGMGDIVIVNVNKMKDAEQIRNLPLFGYLSTAQKELHVGRLPF